ncbi:MAG: hypothetical protein M5U19_21335 [Microthrixaceae bacterium]|nr:hypothetical protein [Microthrixaceae bacterium]
MAAVPSGDDTTLYRSADGGEWQEAGSVAGEQVNGLTWDGDRWFAIARDTDSTTVLASADLREWTEVAQVPAVIEDLDWSDGRFVAVGSTGQGASVAAIYSSTGATSWDEATVASPGPEVSMITDVTRGPGGWVALGVSGIDTDEATVTLLSESEDASSWQSASWSETAVWGFDGARSTVAASGEDLVVAGEPAGTDAVGLHVGPDPDSLADVPGSPFDDDPPTGWPGARRVVWPTPGASTSPAIRSPRPSSPVPMAAPGRPSASSTVRCRRLPGVPPNPPRRSRRPPRRARSRAPIYARSTG